MVPRAGGRSFGRRAGAGRLERIETRPDRSGIHHRTAAPGRARSPLDSGAMEPQRAERLPARHRRRLRHGVRRQPRPLRILGLPARQLRAAIPRLAQRGAGERHGRPAPAATAGRRGGLRRHGVVLPARTAALRPRPAVDTSRRQHAGAAAGGRSALPADPRRGIGGNGQCLEGLFQRSDVPEPCGGQSAFLVPLDPVGRRRRPLRIRILPRTGACGDLRAAARRPACRDRNRHAAAHPTAERRAVPGRKLRPLDGRRACRRRTRSSRIPTVEGRGSLFRQPLRQLVPHRPRHGSRAERISRPDQDVGHEAARQEPAAPLDRPLAAPHRESAGRSPAVHPAPPHP